MICSLLRTSAVRNKETAEELANSISQHLSRGVGESVRFFTGKDSFDHSMPLLLMCS